MDRLHRIGRRASPCVGEATGLVTQKLYADGQGPCYTYTDDGKLATRTWARGVTTSYTYDAWGTLDLAADNPWRFSSEYAEEATATVYYNYRHYEPMSGRWTARDSNRGLELNLYLFSRNLKHARLRDLYLMDGTCLCEDCFDNLRDYLEASRRYLDDVVLSLWW